MSYDIALLDPVSREVLCFDEAHNVCGGTYAAGGTNEAELNVTYNYAADGYPLTRPEKVVEAWNRRAETREE